MTKYLDQNGLAYFWTKIKAWLSSNAPVKYFGQNWVEDTNDDYALVVGNGADGNNPKDVFMIEHDGDLVIGGEDSNKSVSFRGENTTETMIEFESNSDNIDGNGLALGAKGRVIIGSGGAKDLIINDLQSVIDDPRLYIGSAHNIHVYTNNDDPNNAGHFEFTEVGNFNIYNGGWLKQYSKDVGNEQVQSNLILSSFAQYNKNSELLGYSDIYRKSASDVHGKGLYRSFIVRHPSSGYLFGVYFHINDDGTRKLIVAGGGSAEAAIRNGLGASSGIWPISLGGSGMSDALYTSTPADVITPASGITFTSVSCSKWGKVACIRIEWKRNTSFSVGANGDIGDFIIGTLKEGWRPIQWLMFVSGQNNDRAIGYYAITSEGYVKITGFGSNNGAYTLAANTNMQMSACYICS